jgi:hypothetical protein
MILDLNRNGHLVLEFILIRSDKTFQSGEKILKSAKNIQRREELSHIENDKFLLISFNEAFLCFLDFLQFRLSLMTRI